MAEDQLIVSSAVVVPEAQEVPKAAIQRQSPATESRNKRLRVNEGGDYEKSAEDPLTTEHRRSDKRKSGQAEERKRGQRLFGALLGTLSQNSSSAAQRRRDDIEKKQQAKLKLQAAEFDENQKKQLNDLRVSRQHQQKKFDQISMEIRHSNILAAANFLQTCAEPKIYYKPWELRIEEEERIKTQIKEAEALVHAELDRYDARPREEDGFEERRVSESRTNDAFIDTHLEPAQRASTVGSEAPKEVPKSPTKENYDTNPPVTNNNILEKNTGAESVVADSACTVKDADLEIGKDIGDENGEVVLEAEEDTVIY